MFKYLLVSFVLLLVPVAAIAASPFWIIVSNNCGDGTNVAYTIDGMPGNLLDGFSWTYPNRRAHVILMFDNGQGFRPRFPVRSNRTIVFSIDQNSGAVRADW